MKQETFIGEERRKKMKYKFELNINKKDYELLNKWAFTFEKNFEEQAKNVANEIRRCLKEKK